MILSEVQEFISAMYGTLLRFYLPVVEPSLMDELTEDLIELVTSLTINEKLSPWLLKLCRLSSREDEALLSSKIKQFSGLLPEQVGIGEFFTCNSSSKLVSILTQIEQEK